MPITGNADHDEARIDLLERVPAQSPLLKSPRLKVLDKNVGRLDEPLQDLGTLGQTQVQRDRLLVATLGEPRQRVTVIGDRAEPAKGIPNLGKLHLQHFGTELGKLGGAKRAGKKARYIDDADIVERL